MNVVCLDLEFNKKNERLEEIIQIGVAVGCLYTKQIISSKSIYIKPIRPINSRVRALTDRYSNSDITDLSLTEGYKTLRDYLIPFNASKAAIVWGNKDSQYLYTQVRRATKGSKEFYPWPFSKEEIDVRVILKFLLLTKGISFTRSLSNALELFNLSFEGRPHDAKYDAINTLKLYFHLIDITSMRGRIEIPYDYDYY